MGQEAVCRARFEGRESEGKAKLESADLRFAGDFRFTIHTTLELVLPPSAR